MNIARERKEVNMIDIRVESIENMAQWVRDIDFMEVKVGYITKEHFNSLKSTISRINRELKKDGKDLWVKHWFNRKQNRVAILLITREEAEKIKNNISLRKTYEKELPKGFFNKEEYWSIGSWHCKKDRHDGQHTKPSQRTAKTAIPVQNRSEYFGRA